MKYVKLTTKPGGMGHEVARKQMLAARQRCSTDGSLTLAKVNQAGTYYAVFGNTSHAEEFARFCARHNVRHEMLDELPSGARLRVDLTSLLRESQRSRGKTDTPADESELSKFFKRLRR